MIVKSISIRFCAQSSVIRVVGPMRARCPDRATEVDRAPDRLPKDFRPPKDASLETIPGDHPGRVFHRAT